MPKNSHYDLELIADLYGIGVSHDWPDETENSCRFPVQCW